MSGYNSPLQVGQVTVATTKNVGFSAEHWADRCTDKIIRVADDHDSFIKEQALAYKESIRQVVLFYMKNVIKSDRTTLYNLFLQQGETKMAEILRRL